MYRGFASQYYDLETGPHRVKLLEYDLGLSSLHWAMRALLKLGLVAVPIVLIALVVLVLRLLS